MNKMVSQLGRKKRYLKERNTILKNISKVKMKKLNNFLEANKVRLDNPKFKI